MKLFYIFLSVLFFALPCMAQAQMSAENLTAFNNEAIFLNKEKTEAPREWVKEEDQVSGRISRGRLTKMQDITESMIAFLHDSCFASVDFSPIWHGEYSMDKFGIQCRSGDNKTRLTIMSNDMSPLLHFLTVNGKEFAGIHPPAGIQDDCPFFEYENEDHTRSVTWLVTTRRDQLPYIGVTRKEYLQEAHAELTNIKNRIVQAIKAKTPVRPAAAQEAEKKISIDQLNSDYSGADLQVRMRLFLKDYRSDEDYLKESIEKATASLDKTLRLMDSLATRSTAAALNKPAMVSVEAADFIGFEDEVAGRNLDAAGRNSDAADLNMLVRINPAYFSNHTEGGKANLFLVTWSYDPAAGDSGDIDRQIREHIGFGPLQAMLGK